MHLAALVGSAGQKGVIARFTSMLAWVLGALVVSRPLGLWLQRYMTLPEVADLLKVADKTVYTMAQKGELPAFKVRGQWRFKRDDLDAWIERQKVVAVRGRTR